MPFPGEHGTPDVVQDPVYWYRRGMTHPNSGIRIPNNLTVAYCDRCDSEVIIIRKLRDIICGECRIVLFNR